MIYVLAIVVGLACALIGAALGMGVSYVLILLASKFIFREDVNVYRVAGTALIIAGVVLVQIRTGTPNPHGTAPAPAHVRATSE